MDKGNRWRQGRVFKKSTQKCELRLMGMIWPFCGDRSPLPRKLLPHHLTSFGQKWEGFHFCSQSSQCPGYWVKRECLLCSAVKAALCYPVSSHWWELGSGKTASMDEDRKLWFFDLALHHPHLCPLLSWAYLSCQPCSLHGIWMRTLRDRWLKVKAALITTRKTCAWFFSCFLFFLVSTESIYLLMWIEGITLVPCLLFIFVFPEELITALGTQ